MIRGLCVASLLVCAAALRAGGAVDRFGDPLPPGVSARMGATHFRHGASVHSAQFANNGRWLLSVSADGTARLWDAGTGREQGRFPHQSSGQRWVEPRLSPDGKILVTRDKNFRVRVWDVGTGNELPWSLGKNPASQPSPAPHAGDALRA